MNSFTQNNFTPLRVYSEYSLLISCITTKSIIKYCKANNITAIAAADENNMFGAMEWSLDLSSNKIKPIIGSILYVRLDENNLKNIANIWVYCKNHDGYVSLSNLLSKSYVDHNGVLSLSHFKELKNCVLLIDHELELEHTSYLTNILDKTCEIGIAISGQKQEQEFEAKLFHISNALNLSIVAAPKFFYPKPEQMLALDALWCIKDGTYLAEVDRKHAADDTYLLSLQEIQKMFAHIPQAIENANIIGQKCNFFLKKHAPRMPGIDTTDPPEDAFKKLAQIGFEKRMKNVLANNNEDKTATFEIYKARLENEIAMITKMGFCEYFLIVAEIVQWAKKNDIPVGPGRGSGASCLVAWCLEITNIDPMKFNLMFERFLNPDRVSLPDFDIDFCQEKRHLVIEFIQKRFGKENVAHIITFGSLQYRAAIRDIGRVMQFPYTQIDELCKKLPAPVQGIAPTIKELREGGRLQEFITDENKELFVIAESIEGLPRHSSVHAAGLVIGNKKLSDIVPLFKEPGLEMPVIQFSMKPAEQIGLVKFDILGLSVLSMLQKAVGFIKETGIELDLDNLPLDDMPTFEMLQKGMVKAVFQLDSPGFRNLMIEMKPNCFEDIIAAGALYRPGPMIDIPQFVKCKNGIDKAEYLYPEMESILKDTYGVIVYQEQVLQIAKEMAGYSLKDADLLRRAMGKKIKSEMAVHKEKFIAGILTICGGSKEKAESLFEKLARFASYGFPKAHSAPYAIMTYQTAYCKRHYTAPFLCATIFYENTQEKAEEIMQEAKKMGIEIIAPCINQSQANFSLDKEHKKILYGLGKIKGVGEIANQIVAEREKNGPFKSVENFIARVNPNKKVIENFIYSGTFDCFANTESINLSRSQEFENIKNSNNMNTISLFDFESTAIEWTNLELMQKEFETMHMIFNMRYNNLSENLNMCEIHLEKFNIYQKITDIKKFGYVFAIGYKNNIRKTKDGKIMNSYQYFDCNGLQENLINEPYSGEKWEYQLIAIENTTIRYVVRKIYQLAEIMNQYKKIFINTDQKFNLTPGDTSIYNAQNELIGNYQITLTFLNKMQEYITYII